MLRYISQKTKIEYKEWDMDTVTVTDFAVETKINKRMFLDFKKEFQPKIRRGEIEGLSQGNYSLVYQFQKAFLQSLQQQLSNEPVVNRQLESVAINQICFSFNNNDVIKLLIERGDAIKYGNIIKANKIEDKIKQLKDKQYLEMSMPKSAFIIFDDEEGAHRALSTKPNSIKFLDKGLDFKKPSQPSDIIWENRHISKIVWLTKFIIALLVIILLLVATFAGIYILKTWVTRDQFGNINCKNMYNIYKDSFTLQEYAIKEWYVKYQEELDGTLTGALKCF